MKKLENFKSFENFKISSKSMKQIRGSRSKSFETTNPSTGSGVCTKVIDDSSGDTTSVKFKERFAGRC